MPFLDKAGVSRLWMHIIAKLNTKIDREDGKGLSTNDYTDEEKSKLEEVYTRVSEGDIPTTGEGGGAVKSVNGKTGVVELTSEDVGAQPKTLVVTLIEDDNGDYIASHSASEIAAHVANGGDACIIYGDYMYRNDGGSDEAWWFAAVVAELSDTAYIAAEYYIVHDDKTVEFERGTVGELDTGLTSEGMAADAKAVGDALNGKLSKSGGTMTGKIVFPTADQNAGFTNSEDMKIFGYGTFNGAMHMRMGDIQYPFQIRGKGDRPKYNDSEIALMSDIPTDAHINDLINTALGVIENGTY